MDLPGDTTTEFSFVLKPSAHGIGVFATHFIKGGAYLRLFGNEEPTEHRIRVLDKERIPEFFRTYCLDRGGAMACPDDFGMMPVGWYLNHSKDYNAVHRSYHWYAARDIAPGEEILINYNSLEEPDEARGEYYIN